jgi:hypothetical protein
VRGRRKRHRFLRAAVRWTFRTEETDLAPAVLDDAVQTRHLGVETVGVLIDTYAQTDVHAPVRYPFTPIDPRLASSRIYDIAYRRVDGHCYNPGIQAGDEGQDEFGACTVSEDAQKERWSHTERARLF